MSEDSKLYRILVVDDDPDSQKILATALDWDGYQVMTASSGAQALQLIEEWLPDLLLLDVHMPGVSGLETLRAIRARELSVPVLLISGESDSQIVVQGLDLGAEDYIAKPFDPMVMLARVRTQLRIKGLHDQLRDTNEKLKELVDTDDLTGLLNMRSLYQRLELEFARGRRFHRSVCVVMMDMDYFKSVNDGHDHLFGSFVLSEVGKIIKNTIRNVDIAARYGGDEFLIVLTEVDIPGARAFCERLRKNISKFVFKNGEDNITLTTSIGFAIKSPEDDKTDARELVRAADHALYAAKEAGRNRVHFNEKHYQQSSPDRSALTQPKKIKNS